MKTAHKHVTMDGKELQLLERYEERFGETPPVHFLAPETPAHGNRGHSRQSKQSASLV